MRTWPTAGSPRRSTSRCRSASRCCSKVRPGVGKTEVAKVLSALLGRDLIRLQCYEGIDASQALYEWNYSRQLIAVRAMDAAAADAHVQDLFGIEFLVERPLLAAIKAGSRAVLLVDELDRADDEFEAFLLEILSEFAVTIPEVGRIGPSRRRRSSSRRTARASCTTPSSDGVSITGSITRTGSRGGDRARPRAARRRGARARRGERGRAAPRRWTWRRRPASPRRSTGRTRWRSSGRNGSTRGRRRHARARS